MEKIHTQRVIVVEGRYDAARLETITDAAIITTNGFDIYTDNDKKALLKQLAQKDGLILLTDADAAGQKIRTYIADLVGQEHVLHIFTPAVAGKEARKAEPGKEGLLGVEGIDTITLRELLRQTVEADIGNAEPAAEDPVTYTDLYEWGLSGTTGSQYKKSLFLKKLNLPQHISKKQLLEVLNRLYKKSDVEAAVRSLSDD